MIDLGTGPAIVLIPGVQGRWEWMRPTVEALARRCRVVTASLCGDRDRRGVPFRDPAPGFNRFVAYLDAMLDRARLPSASLCGVSYGGLIALRYATERPERVRSLVLVSTPSPTWRLSWRVRTYVRAPRLLSPLFVLSSPFRLWPEIAAAFPRWDERLAFTARHVGRVVLAPFSPKRMGGRVQLLAGEDFLRDCSLIRAPTLVVTGERDLDKVVPVEGTREYLGAIAGATSATIERTGHIGLISRPERFSNIVATFIAAHDAAGQAERQRA